MGLQTFYDLWSFYSKTSNLTKKLVSEISVVIHLNHGAILCRQVPIFLVQKGFRRLIDNSLLRESAKIAIFGR